MYCYVYVVKCTVCIYQATFTNTCDFVYKQVRMFTWMNRTYMYTLLTGLIDAPIHWYDRYMHHVPPYKYSTTEVLNDNVDGTCIV